MQDTPIIKPLRLDRLGGHKPAERPDVEDGIWLVGVVDAQDIGQRGFEGLERVLAAWVLAEEAVVGRPAAEVADLSLGGWIVRGRNGLGDACSLHYIKQKHKHQSAHSVPDQGP